MKKLMISIAFLTSVPALSCDFPGHWWAPVTPPGSAPDWEITPDRVKCKDGRVVLSKRNELGIFSNFTESPFFFEGIRYRSVEGFWQMLKFPDSHPKDPRNKLKWPMTRKQVSQMVAFEAKKAGDIGSKNMKTLGINWVTYKNKKMIYRTTKKRSHYQLIKKVMWAKLMANKKMQKLLLQTRNLKLIPDHIQKTPTPPAWKYHEIWMEFRARLQGR